MHVVLWSSLGSSDIGLKQGIKVNLVDRWWQTSPVFGCLQTENYRFRWGSPVGPPHLRLDLNSSYKELDFQNKYTYVNMKIFVIGSSSDGTFPFV